MSRIHRLNIWEFYFKKQSVGRCLCCKKTILIKTAKVNNLGFWHRGHIIHDKDGGPDTYENIRPICIDCNHKDKNYKTSLHYMEIIGTINKNEIPDIINNIKEKAINNIIGNVKKCIKYTNKGKLCVNNPVKGNYYCRIHDENYCEEMKYCQNLIIRETELLEYTIKSLKNLSNCQEDIEELNIINSMIDENCNVII